MIEIINRYDFLVSLFESLRIEFDGKTSCLLIAAWIPDEKYCRELTPDRKYVV